MCQTNNGRLDIKAKALQHGIVVGSEECILLWYKSVQLWCSVTVHWWNKPATSHKLERQRTNVKHVSGGSSVSNLSHTNWGMALVINELTGMPPESQISPMRPACIQQVMAAPAVSSLDVHDNYSGLCMYGAVPLCLLVILVCHCFHKGGNCLRCQVHDTLPIDGHAWINTS